MPKSPRPALPGGKNRMGIKEKVDRKKEEISFVRLRTSSRTEKAGMSKYWFMKL